MRGRVNQNVLRLDVSMTDTLRVNICNRSEQLVRVDFDKQVRDHLLHLQILFHYPVGCIRDVVHDHIQINFVFLISTCVERLAHFDTVWVMQLS